MDFGYSTLTTPDLYDDRIVELLEPLSVKLSLPAKYIFSRPGENLGFIYFVRKGRTKHFMDNSDGLSKILYTLTPGWFFGETPCFLDIPTGLYSQTETETVLFKVPNDVIQRLLVENELFRQKLLQCSCYKLLILRFEVANLTFHSCKKRLLRLFASSVDTENVTDPGWYNLKIRYTQSELGEIIGGARVTISRQMNELCCEGYIRMVNRRVQMNAEEYHKLVHSSEDDM